MMETLDETELKKKLLEELQGAMSSRRVSPVLEIAIAPGKPETTDADDASENLEDASGEELAGEDLEEPTDVKSRIGKLLKSRGMMG